MGTKEDDVKYTLLIASRIHRISSAYWYDIWARLLPVAVIYVNSGLTAAVATACSLVLADRQDAQPSSRKKCS